MREDTPSEAFHSISKLCRRRNLTESKLIEELEHILAADPDVAHETNSHGETIRGARGMTGPRNKNVAAMPLIDEAESLCAEPC